MAMSERVARLRQASLEAVPTISAERAELITEFYRQNVGPGMMSAPMRRALAFQYLLAHKAICINEGELIVGERGPAPKATPTVVVQSTSTPTLTATATPSPTLTATATATSTPTSLPKTPTPSPTPMPPAQPFTLTLLHTNDTWGYTQPCG